MNAGKMRIGKIEESLYTVGMEEMSRDHGVQPLDALLEMWQLTSHELVELSPEQMNHKQIQKARKGRQLTLHLMQKVTRALNIAIWERLDAQQREWYVEYMHRHLFTYAKGYDAAWQDPNVELAANVVATKKKDA